jgi:hypothetical protein
MKIDICLIVRTLGSWVPVLQLPFIHDLVLLDGTPASCSFYLAKNEFLLCSAFLHVTFLLMGIDAVG